ncbi:MAG: hypothetical protein JRF63_11375, partial [Deltaproteobacteria bacterium]|nr:hypothetical protein [Deltaproteobacteria bacterium]
MIEVKLTAGSGTFGETVAQVLDGIGVVVERVTLIDDTTLELELEVEDSGPGGWLGVLLTTGAEQAIAPIRIIGEDQALTLALTPDDVEPGTRAAQYQAVAPTYADFDAVFTTACAGVSGAYASLDQLLTDSMATVLVDVAFDAEIPEDGIPIFLTTSKGAVVGFLQSESLSNVTANDAEPFEDTLGEGETRVVTVTADSLPAIVTTSFAEPDYADLACELLVQTPDWPIDQGGGAL